MDEHVDEVRITIAIRQDLTTPPTETILVVFRPDRATIDRAALRSGLLSAFATPDHTFDERYHVHQWGSSGAILQFAMDVTEGLGVDLAKAGIVGAVGFAIAKLKQPGATGDRLTEISESEATREVQRSIQHLGQSVEILIETATQADDGKCVTFQAKTDDGRTVSIDVTKTESGAVFFRIR